MKCQQCQVEATRVGEFWICPTHGQLPEVKQHAPMRIFLSYGHDANEELVRRIKAGPTSLRHLAEKMRGCIGNHYNGRSTCLRRCRTARSTVTFDGLFLL
jgi:hypothetical protein